MGGTSATGGRDLKRNVARLVGASCLLMAFVVEPGLGQAQNVINSEATAIAAANRIANLDTLTEMPPRAVQVTLSVEDGFLPFNGLHERMIGRTLWKITYQDITLDRVDPNTEEREESPLRAFDVFLDPESGLPLKIVSHWPEAADRCRDLSGWWEGVSQFIDDRFSAELPSGEPCYTADDVLRSRVGMGTEHVEVYLGSTSGPDRSAMWLVVRYAPPERPSPECARVVNWTGVDGLSGKIIEPDGYIRPMRDGDGPFRRRGPG